MNRRSLIPNAFSLIEVTFALGVAAFCLLIMLGLLPAGLKTQQASVEQTVANEIISQISSDLRAAVRLPPGQQSKQFSLHPHNGGRWDPTPDWLYFTINGTQTGSTNQEAVPTDPPAAFRATISYIFPPTDTTSLANITVTWPAQVDPITGVPGGSVQTFVATNR
jgi:type II secretory pathway pseudopilin PulG